jgi:ribonuclease P protein component
MEKEFRITKSSDFKTVLDQRHCAGKNSSVSVFYAENKDSHAHIGISVSNKIGNAVTRVRVRRQIRAQINLTDVLSKHFDIVIIAHSGYLEKTFQENTEILKKCFLRLSSPTKGEKHEK